MENEDEERFCKNCKRHVSAANFATHSAFCERNIFVCKICEEPVQISEKDQHLEEYHAVLSCDDCGIALEKWLLPKHMESCPKRLVACEYCKAEFPFDKHFEHVDFCGSRTEKCLLCQKYVRKKEKAAHDQFHLLDKQHRSKSIEEEIKQNKVNEVISKASMEGKISGMTSKEKHGSLTYERRAVSRPTSKVRDEAEASFLDKSSNMIRKYRNVEILEAEGATSSVPEKKEFSKHHTQCHICKQDIPWIDFNTHVPACASSAGKCSMCGENVPSYAIKDHMKEHFQSRFQRPSTKVPETFGSYPKTTSGSGDENYATKSKVNDAVIKCPYCSQHCSRDRISEHIRECPSNVYKCELCCEMVPEKDKTRHEKSECRMLQDIAEPSKPHFSRNASQMSFECPLCNEDIPEENRENHLSFECQKLLSSGETHKFYNMGDDSLDSHECPYCGSKMRKKDKVKHESFECQVLIDNSGVNLVASESYAEVTKKPCKHGCKCCQKSKKCKNGIPVNKLSEHTRSSQQQKFPCFHCDELIDPNTEEIHLKFCTGLSSITEYADFDFSVSENSRSSNYEQKGAKPKITDIRNMMTPRSAKCKYCHTSFNADIAKFHEDECLHKPIQCPKCSSEVLLKDCKSHKCKGQRQNRYGKNKTVEQQTAVQKEEPGLLQRWKNRFGLLDGKEEGKSKYMSLQSQDYYPGQRNVSRSVPDAEYLYFAQTEDPLLPCEFCQQNFPASSLVLHMTGCQPELVCYAKPDSHEDSKRNESRSAQECASLPTKPSSLKNDTVPTRRSKNVQPTTMTSPFFSSNNSFLKSTGYERKEDREESSVEPGEFLSSYKSSCRHDEYSESAENGVEGKREEPSHFLSPWDAGNLKGPSSEDGDSKQISDHSDTEMDIDQTEKTAFKEASISEQSKELEIQVSDELFLYDSEVDDMLNFIEKKDSTEFYEEYSIHSDKKGDKVKKSEKEVCAVFDDTQYQGDLPVSKNKTIGEKENVKFMYNSVQNQKECASQHLANFRFGSHKSTKADNIQNSVQPKDIYEEPEKLYKLKTLKCTESTEDETGHISSSKQMLYLKLGRYDSPVEGHVSEMNEEEPGKMSKETVAERLESSKDQRQYLYSCRYLPNFKPSAHESAVFPDKVHRPVQCEKQDKMPVKPYAQTPPKSSLNIEEEKIYRSRCLANFKFGNHESTTSSAEENLHNDILDGKNGKSPETLYKQKNTTYSVNTTDEKVYLHNFKQHLSDFEYGVLKAKSVSPEDDKHTVTSAEGRNESHRKSAFKIEPAESEVKEIKHPSCAAMKKEGKALEGLEERIAKLQRVAISEDDNDDFAKWKKWRQTYHDSGSD